MRNKDFIIKSEIEEILQSDSVGQNLKSYFGNLPDNKIRRSISILSTVYPDKITIPNDDFVFIIYILSNKKFIEQESFFEFVRSLNIIDYTQNQKDILIGIIKLHFEILCENCTFELDNLLIKIFERIDLFKYMEVLARDSRNIAVLEHISDILRYEDFSNCNI